MKGGELPERLLSTYHNGTWHNREATIIAVMKGFS